MSRQSDTWRREERERRKRGFRRARRLILLLGVIGCLAVSPGARRSISNALHLDVLLQGQGSASERLADYLASFKAGRPEEILLVNFEHPLPDGYQPKELVCLYEQRHSFQLASTDIYLEKEVYEAMERLFAAAEKEGVNGFIVTSGYRSEEKQREIYAQSGQGLANQPGHSEHQTGLAFDVTTWYDTGGFQDTAQYRWLIAHCAQYGFILRYPEGKQAVTGVETEYWHYRYVGEHAAREIMRKGLALEEYLTAGQGPVPPAAAGVHTKLGAID